MDRGRPQRETNRVAEDFSSNAAFNHHLRNSSCSVSKQPMGFFASSTKDAFYGVTACPMPMACVLLVA